MEDTLKDFTPVWSIGVSVVDPDFIPRMQATDAVINAIYGIWAPKRELTEDDKAIHRAIKHHQP